MRGGAGRHRGAGRGSDGAWRARQRELVVDCTVGRKVENRFVGRRAKPLHADTSILQTCVARGAARWRCINVHSLHRDHARERLAVHADLERVALAGRIADAQPNVSRCIGVTAQGNGRGASREIR